MITNKYLVLPWSGQVSVTDKGDLGSIPGEGLEFLTN